MLFRNRRNRFIFIELIVALISSMMMFGAVAGSFTMVRKSGAATGTEIDMRQALPKGMQIILTDLRAAGSNPAGLKEVGIQYAGQTAIRFTSDRNGDGDVEDFNEDVTYRFDDRLRKILRKRSALDVPKPFARNVRNFSLTYYDMHGKETMLPARIRNIRLLITVDGGRKQRRRELVYTVTPQCFETAQSRYSHSG